MEFFETHTGNNVKAIWKNDIDASVEATGKSNDDDDDDDDSNNEEEDTVDSENEEEDKEEKKAKEKIADKVISDLEVCCKMINIVRYNINYY